MRIAFLLILATVWLAAAGTGFAVLLDYQKTPGGAGAAPGIWPASSRLKRNDGRPKVILFAHPNCPCTRATLEELAWISTRSRGRADFEVVFYRPEGAVDRWGITEARRRAAELPVEVSEDSGAVEAKLFGAETSGHVVAYDALGRLAFAGGITAGRGHRGDNEGRRAVLAFALGEGRNARTKVFGCELAGAAERARAKACKT